MLSIDMGTGFDKSVLNDADWGLGGNMVQGAVDPDEYEVCILLLSELSLSPIVGKKLGDKDLKMIYANERASPTKNAPTSKVERATLAPSNARLIGRVEFEPKEENSDCFTAVKRRVVAAEKASAIQAPYL